MGSRGAILRRYALALSQIPDLDVARDLFMEAATDAQLRRAIRRWRSQEGYPELEEEEPLVELTADQEADALHLARRGARRRGLRRGAAVLVACGLGLAVLLLTARQQGLLADPVFADRPPIQSESWSGSRLGIYKVEATPGSIEVWWELTGPAAADGGGPLGAPRLVLSGSGGAWLEPVARESANPRPDRLVGRSTYRVAVGEHDAVTILLGGQAMTFGGWQVTAPITHAGEGEGARTIAVGRSVSTGGYLFRVDEVITAPHYTMVRYRVLGLEEAVALRHLVQVAVDGVPLEHLAPPKGEPAALVALLDPVPQDAGHLVVTFAAHLPGGVEVSPVRSSEVVSLSREGERLTARLRVSSHFRDPYSAAPSPFAAWPWEPEGSYLIDTDGLRYEALAIYEGEDVSRGQYGWRLETRVPAGTPLEGMKVYLPRVRLSEPVAVPVPLAP